MELFLSRRQPALLVLNERKSPWLDSSANWTAFEGVIIIVRIAVKLTSSRIGGVASFKFNCAVETKSISWKQTFLSRRDRCKSSGIRRDYSSFFSSFLPSFPRLPARLFARGSRRMIKQVKFALILTFGTWRMRRCVRKLTEKLVRFRLGRSWRGRTAGLCSAPCPLSRLGRKRLKSASPIARGRSRTLGWTRLLSTTRT